MARSAKGKKISTQMKRPENSLKEQNHKSDDKMYIQSFTNTGTAKQQKTRPHSNVLHMTRGRSTFGTVRKIIILFPLFETNLMPLTVR